MRTLLFVNNWVGWQVTRFLREQQANLVGLVLHPAGRRKYGDEIIHDSGLDARLVFDGSTLKDPKTLATLAALEPELGLSAFFGYILKQPVLDLFPAGAVNLHPALLPYNRGSYPNLWSLLDGTPAGVSLHYMDLGVDSGDLIAQKEVPTHPTDTGQSLYQRLEQTSIELLRTTWPLLARGQAPRKPQPTGGTSHRARDVEAIDEIDPDRMVRAGDLINLLRARTFPPYPGAYIRSNGRKIFLRLELLDEAELASGS